MDNVILVYTDEDLVGETGIALDGDTTLYGPYAMAEAQAVAEKIEGHRRPVLKTQILPVAPWPGV